MTFSQPGSTLSFAICTVTVWLFFIFLNVERIKTAMAFRGTCLKRQDCPVLRVFCRLARRWKHVVMALRMRRYLQCDDNDESVKLASSLWERVGKTGCQTTVS